ncbi:MAG: hypothetical protein PHY77_01730 [Desulfotomaculaceae bacterium]|nr:hypothetical protein [Desulfotomaculaceae bacterium]
MKKLGPVILIFLLGVFLFGCTKGEPGKDAQPQQVSQQTADKDEAAVRSQVENFGRKLQAVSLQAPDEVVNKSIQDNYGEFVFPALLAEWQKNHQNVPGRLVSSPWPDRIGIMGIEKISDSAYRVTGEIIEITSAEAANGGAAARKPIDLVLGKIADRWLITEVKLGEYEKTSVIVYRNTQYGFNFTLPESWQGYSVITDKWEGLAPGGGAAVETGPLLNIRHPQWTAQNQRQDIPIMIFTPKQWDSLQQGNFHIGAAPVGPSELNRSADYVFALPARYNYAFPTGYEEVEKILQGPLQMN